MMKLTKMAMALGLAVTATVAVGTPASATTGVVANDAITPQNSLVVPVSDLRSMGITDPEELRSQEALLNSLTDSEQERQAAELAAQSALFSSDEIITPDNVGVGGGGGVRARIVNSGCATSDYKVIYLNAGDQGTDRSRLCYKSVGTRAMHANPIAGNAFGVSPGGWTGRVFYHQNNNYYWSTTRSPSQSVYEFNGMYGRTDVYRIQITK